LEALPDAMAKPEHLPYSLMSRLLRCRMIAEAGQPAAATSLLGRMGDELKDWMSNQGQERNNARRLVGLVQYRVVARWMEQLKSATQPASTDAARVLEPLLDSVRAALQDLAMHPFDSDGPR